MRPRVKLTTAIELPEWTIRNVDNWKYAIIMYL